MEQAPPKKIARRKIRPLSADLFGGFFVRRFRDNLFDPRGV
jgi:hypothetical protein